VGVGVPDAARQVCLLDLRTGQQPGLCDLPPCPSTFSRSGRFLLSLTSPPSRRPPEEGRDSRAVLGATEEVPSIRGCLE
jgi:hypothetical protein